MKGDTFPDGQGLFETILTLHGTPQLVIEHLERARGSATTLGWQFPAEQEIARVITHLIEASPSSSSKGRLRLIFTPEGGVEGAHTSYERWAKPAKVTLSPKTIFEDSPLVAMKLLPYRENIEILEKARRSGFDDAIRLNNKGEVAESSVANLFLKVAGKWITPPKDSGILPGIIRGLALQCSLVEEDRLLARDLPSVESIFLVNSLKGFQPVESLDDEALEVDGEFSKIIATLPQFGSVG